MGKFSVTSGKVFCLDITIYKKLSPLALGVCLIDKVLWGAKQKALDTYHVLFLLSPFWNHSEAVLEALYILLINRKMSYI